MVESYNGLVWPLHTKNWDPRQIRVRFPVRLFFFLFACCPFHKPMQDNARLYANSDTLADLASRGVTTIFWPPYSPGLNPIKDIWNWMKDCIQRRYPQETMTFDRLRVVVREAWEAVLENFLRERLETINDRCDSDCRKLASHKILVKFS